MTEPFWQRSIGAVDQSSLLAFLDEGVPEGDHLEYKLPTYNRQSQKFEFTHEFLETIVAFANSGGGMMICGVGEDSQKRPAAIEGIRVAPQPGGAPRDPISVLRDTCAAVITPQVSIETITVPIPAGQHQGNLLLVVRVRRGTLPPYGINGEDIYIRTGDMDRRAKVREIASLFERRAEQGITDEPPWAQIVINVFGYEASTLLGPQHLMVGLRPVFPIDPISASDQMDDTFRRMCVEHFGPDRPFTLGSNSVTYAPILPGGNPDGPYACAYTDGTVGIRTLLHLGPPAPEQLQLPGLWIRMRDTLQLAARWPRDVCRYGGPLLCRIAITGLRNVTVAHPHPWTTVIALPTSQNKLMTWWDEMEWDSGNDVNNVIDRSLASLSRQLQFPSYPRIREWVQEQVAQTP